MEYERLYRHKGDTIPRRDCILGYSIIAKKKLCASEMRSLARCINFPLYFFLFSVLADVSQAASAFKHLYIVLLVHFIHFPSFIQDAYCCFFFNSCSIPNFQRILYAFINYSKPCSTMIISPGLGFICLFPRKDCYSCHNKIKTFQKGKRSSYKYVQHV